MTVPQALWEEYKDEILDLYFRRNTTISEVIRIMKRKGLNATYVFLSIRLYIIYTNNYVENHHIIDSLKSGRISLLRSPIISTTLRSLP